MTAPVQEAVERAEAEWAAEDAAIEDAAWEPVEVQAEAQAPQVYEAWAAPVDAPVYDAGSALTALKAEAWGQA